MLSYETSRNGDNFYECYWLVVEPVNSFTEPIHINTHNSHHVLCEGWWLLPIQLIGCFSSADIAISVIFLIHKSFIDRALITLYDYKVITYTNSHKDKLRYLFQMYLFYCNYFIWT